MERLEKTLKEGSLDGPSSFSDGHFDLKLNILNDY